MTTTDGERVATARRSRTRIALAATAALVLGACGVDRDRAASEPPRASGWRAMATAPLSGRILPAAVWTGSELLVWGGASCEVACDGRSLRSHEDGAAYDAVGDRWRGIAPSPLSARYGSLAVWTGREAIVWGGSAGAEFFPDGAAYDPAQDRWRSLPPSPLTARFGVPRGTVAQVPGVWTGTEMIVWGQGAGIEEPVDGLPQGAAYNPESNAWRLLPPAPINPRIVVPVWTGREMLIWGGQSGPRYFEDGAAYDPTSDRWRVLPTAPITARFTFPAWSGDELLVWGGESAQQAFDDGAAYDPVADRWRPIAPSGLVARRGFGRVWTGRELVIWGGVPGTGRTFLGDGAAFDPAAGAWREIDRWNARLLPLAAWTGEDVLLWGGIVFTSGERMATSNDGARLSP